MDTIIAIPTNRGIKPQTLQSLLGLRGYQDVLVSSEGFNTAENRTWLAAQAIKKGAKYIFWADDDMIYEPDTIERLRAHDKDIVGAKYPNRRGDGEVVEYGDETGDLIRVKALGGGCVLTKAEVFYKIPQPWFWYKINEHGAVTMSHDWWFSERAREHGYEVWCDTTLKPGHIGKKEF